MKIYLSIILAGMCILGCSNVLQAASPEKNIRVQQHTKEALMETFIIAFATENVDMLWELLPPDLRRRMSMNSGVATAKKNIWNSAKFNTSQATMKAMKTLQKDDATRKLVAAEMARECNKYIVKDNGKYYIDLLKLAASDTTAEQAAAVKKPKAIDHSTPEKLLETFYLAACFKDADLVFDALSPEMRAQATSREQIDKAKKTILNALTSVWTPQMIEQFKMLLSGNSKHQFIATLKMTLKDQLVFINGKWYLDFTKKKNPK